MKNIFIVILCLLCLACREKAPDNTCKQLLQTLSDNVSLSYNSENYALDDSIVLCSEKGNNFLLTDSIQSPRLIFRFSENACDACILKVFECLMTQNVQNNNILVIATYKDNRTLKIFKTSNNITVPIYRIVFGDLDLPVERKNVPYLFMLDNDKISKLLFVPNQYHLQFTAQYFEVVKKRFFNSDTNENSVIMGVTQIHYKFGKVKSEQKAIAEFLIYNAGTKPMVINSIETTCGCTVPTWERKPIMPGDTATVKIQYDTKRMGYFSKRVFVHSNAANSPLGLTVSGEIVPDIKQKEQ
jgi:hypothetical protein